MYSYAAVGKMLGVKLVKRIFRYAAVALFMYVSIRLLPVLYTVPADNAIDANSDNVSLYRQSSVNRQVTPACLNWSPVF